MLSASIREGSGNVFAMAGSHRFSTCPSVTVALLLVFRMHAAASGQAGSDETCLYTSTQCSCSKYTPTEPMGCPRVLSLLPELTAICQHGVCGESHRCDCNGPLLCRRQKCEHWTPDNEAEQHDVAKATFPCSLEEATCVTEDETGTVDATADTPAYTFVPATNVPPTTLPATTTTTTTTIRVACADTLCPPCFVPSESCGTCIPDTSMRAPEALACPICSGGGDAFCGTTGRKCCPNDSECRARYLPARGLSQSTLAFICSDSCDEACDRASADTCAQYSAQPIGLPVPPEEDQIASIASCASLYSYQ